MANQVTDRVTVGLPWSESQGAPGDSAEIVGATAVPLPPGADPTVTLGGTPTERTIEFGIPEGEKGDSGSGSVNSVNGDFGPDIVLDAADVGAVREVNGKSGLDIHVLLRDITPDGLILVTDFGAVGDGVSDDTLAIQAALDEATSNGGGIVVFPPRMYLISDFLAVGSGTSISAYGAYIRNTAGRGLIRNFLAADSAPGYTGKSNIAISGGVWDQWAWNGTDGVQGGVTTAFNFVHGSNIIVRDVTIRDVHGGHAVEFNAIDGGTVTDSVFEGYTNGGDSARDISEAVQIDCALNILMEPKDLTPARNINITRCISRASPRLGAWGRFAGSHTGVTSQTMGAIYDDITIRDNAILNCLTWGIYGYGWQNVTIEGNNVVAPGVGGIACVVPKSATWGYAMRVENVRISDNKIVNSDGSGVLVDGDPQARMSCVQVSGNQVVSSAANAIEIKECGAPIVSGNHVRNTDGGAGILCISFDAMIQGNSVYNTSTNGINVQQYAGTVVQNNLVHTTRANYGIYVGPGSNGSPGTNVSILGNRVFNPTTAGIRLSTAATECTIMGNIVRKGSGSASSGILNVAGATGARIVNNDLAQNGWTAARAINVSTSSPITAYGGGSSVPGDNLV